MKFTEFLSILLFVFEEKNRHETPNWIFSFFSQYRKCKHIKIIRMYNNELFRFKNKTKLCGNKNLPICMLQFGGKYLQKTVLKQVGEPVLLQLTLVV